MSDLVFNATKRGFIKSCALIGNTIEFNGIVKTKGCIASSIEHKRDHQANGFLPQAATACDMLATDFVELGLADRSEVKIDGVSLRILTIEKDAADPCVHLILAAAR